MAARRIGPATSLLTFATRRIELATRLLAFTTCRIGPATCLLALATCRIGLATRLLVSAARRIGPATHLLALAARRITLISRLFRSDAWPVTFAMWRFEQVLRLLEINTVSSPIQLGESCIELASFKALHMGNTGCMLLILSNQKLPGSCQMVTSRRLQNRLEFFTNLNGEIKTPRRSACRQRK
ncbi:MAG: hypothetical protein JWL59_1429 [Chthoniobacteraceae bacterium]|nr:hypothetical protein [Chthoniobacteraceae bacterium]